MDANNNQSGEEDEEWNSGDEVDEDPQLGVSVELSLARATSSGAEISRGVASHSKKFLAWATSFKNWLVKRPEIHGSASLLKLVNLIGDIQPDLLTLQDQAKAHEKHLSLISRRNQQSFRRRFRKLIYRVRPQACCAWVS